MICTEYNMPDPIVADMSKIPDTVLPETYVYDIPTEPGQEIELVRKTSMIDDIIAGETVKAEDTAAYDILGRRVDDSYKGFVISGGKKIVRR